MLHKIIDFLDTKDFLIILIDNKSELMDLTLVLQSIGLERLSYEVYGNDIIFYTMEISMPHNRYLAMLRELRKRKYNLKSDTKVNTINRLIKV